VDGPSPAPIARRAWVNRSRPNARRLKLVSKRASSWFSHVSHCPVRTGRWWISTRDNWSDGYLPRGVPPWPCSVAPSPRTDTPARRQLRLPVSDNYFCRHRAAKESRPPPGGTRLRRAGWWPSDNGSAGAPTGASAHRKSGHTGSGITWFPRRCRDHRAGSVAAPAWLRRFARSVR
jgi:hypothetical protein